jgi:hypothetical protein
LLAEIPHGIDSLVPIVPFDTQHTLLNPGHVSRFNNGFCHLYEFLLARLGAQAEGVQAEGFELR